MSGVRTDRWAALSARLGGSTGPAPDVESEGGRRPPAAPAEAADAGTADAGIDLAEAFVRTGADRRQTLDLLCLALVRRETGEELVVRGPEALRGQTRPAGSGLAVTDVALGAAGQDLVSLAVLVCLVPRRPLARDIVAAIEDLGTLLDYRRDPARSRSVADFVWRRLDVLTRMPGVTTPILHTVPGPVAPPPGGTRHLLLGAGVPAPETVRVRDRRLVVADPERTSGWRGSDYALVRLGPRPARGESRRDFRQLRREHALVDVAYEPARETGEESFGVRTARSRQLIRAKAIVGRAVDGDQAAAVRICRLALGRPADTEALADGLTGEIGTVADYWAVRDALTEAGAVPAGSLPATARTVLERITRRLDDLLGLAATGERIPIATPIIVDVGEALVPFVDDRRDGGLFLRRLIPDMKDRIHAQTGVRVPGVRARPDPGLGETGFAVELDEVTITTGQVDLAHPYAVGPVTGPVAHLTAELLSELHPVTGEAGFWDIRRARDGDPAGHRLGPPEYLSHRIDMTIRSRLELFLGIQEVFDGWINADEAVRAVAGGDDAEVRLTWLLQALVRDRVPVTDVPAVLEGIRDGGGMAAPLRDLCRAVRFRLRARLPGRQAGRVPVPIPPELQEAVPVADRPDVAGHFGRWFTALVRERGPAVALVAGTDEVRETAAAVLRAGDVFAATLTEREAAG